MINAADQNFKTDEPSTSVPALINILKAIDRLHEGYWREQKSKDIKDLIAAAAGLWFESYTLQAVQALGDSIRLRSDIVLQSKIPVKLLSVNRTIQDFDLKEGISKSIQNRVLAKEITEPYWLFGNHPMGMFKIDDQQLIGYPEKPSAATIDFSFRIADQEISYQRPPVYKYTDQVRGEVYQPLIVAPAVTASIADKAYVFSGNTAKTIQVSLKSFRDKTEGSLSPQVPSGWKIEPQRIEFNLPKKGDEKTVQFTISPSEQAESGKFTLSIQSGGQRYNRAHRIIDYAHIPIQNLFPLAEAKIERVELKTGGEKVGYISGAGDLIPESLQQIGYQVSTLSESEIMNTDLSQYDAIITGVRAYNVNERFTLMQPKLMEYVSKGGTLLVQYNVSNPLLVQNIGPYPFKITRDRVTDENASVRFLEKGHPVLNYPNKITARDFEGWIQ